MALPVALQVYSVRDYASEDFKGTMEKVKAMGYDGVELAGLYGHTAVELKAVLDEVGLEFMSAHVPVAELENDEVLDDYAAAGLKYIAIPWMSVEPTEESVAQGLATINGIAKRCKARGMQLLYHNHDFEFKKVNDQYILETFYNTIPDELLQSELDTCWVNVGGEKPDDYVRKYTGKAPVVHLKDFAGKKSENMYALIGSSAKKEDSEGEFEFRPLGYGLQDVPSIVEAAEDAGAKWVVVEQDRPSLGKTSLECVEMSINYLKEKGLK